MMTTLRKHRTHCLVSLLLVMTSYNLFIYFFTAYPFNVPRNFMADAIPTRRELVRRIMKIQREIEARSEKSREVDAMWAKQLLFIAAELDPRVNTWKKNSKSHTDTRDDLDDSEKSTSHNTTQESWASVPEVPSLPQELRICPEVYRGRQFDNNLRNNFMPIPCEAQELKDVLTILLPVKGWEVQRVEFILDSIRKFYNVKVVVLTYGYVAKMLDRVDVSIKRFSADKVESEAINEVISSIETPYTLVAHSLIYFDIETHLERLVRVLEENPESSVAAGAYRDANGLWHHGCSQVTAENYQLEYIRGYEHSRSECMYCDDVLGPFLVRTEFLMSVYMTETMEGSTMYRDWFLNVRLDRKLVLSCPDVMFYIDAEPRMNKDDWYKISQKWSVEYVASYDGTTHKFSCDDAQISCHKLMKTVSSFLIAPCCREVFRKELEYVQNCAEEIGVHYEIYAGTLLGGVKMDGMLPWDFDSDVIVDCKDKDVWMSKGFDCLAKKGCTLKPVIGNYWASTCNASTVDLNCFDNASQKYPEMYRKTPTKLYYDGILTKAPLNPGRNARNYFGDDCLKHAVHWRYSSNSGIIPMDNEPKPIPGLWNTCIVPAFHSCMDHFPTDGNIKFHKTYCQKGL